MQAKFFQEEYRTIWKWAEKYSGLKAIWAFQDGPRPERPYVLLTKLTGQIKQGSVDTIVHESDDTFEIVGDRRQSIQIDIFGQNALERLTILRDTLEDPNVVDLLFSGGVSIIEEGEPRDLSLLRETHFETRASLEMIVGLRTVRTTNLGAIESTIVEGDTDGFDLGPTQIGP